MTFTTARKIVSLTVLAAAGVVVGCQDAQYPPIGANEQFRPDDERRAMDVLSDAQTANGAREDGTLYASHFTDGCLNSLGYQKLSAMAYGPEQQKLAIYLAVPKGEQFASCQDSVVKALARGGVSEDRYTITAGSNPNLSSPAAAGLQSLAHLHGGASDQTSSPDTATINPTGKQ